MTCSFTLKGAFYLIALVSKPARVVLINILVTFSCLCLSLLCLNNSYRTVLPINLLAVAVTDGKPMQWDAAEAKMAPHWQGGYTFSGAVRESRIKMMLSQSLKICKLQKQLVPKGKPIAGRHQSVLHGDKQERLHARLYKAALVIQACAESFSSVAGGLRTSMAGWSLEVKGWGLCLSPCNLSVVISLPLSSPADLHSSKVTGCCWYSLFPPPWIDLLQKFPFILFWCLDSKPLLLSHYVYSRLPLTVFLLFLEPSSLTMLCLYSSFSL